MNAFWVGAGIRPRYSADEVAANSDTVTESTFDRLRSMILAEDKPVIEHTIV